MKTRITIELETEKMNKFTSKDVGGDDDGEDYTKEVEMDFHKIFVKCVEELIEDEDHEFTEKVFTHPEIQFIPERVSSINDIGEVRIGMSSEEIRGD